MVRDVPPFGATDDPDIAKALGWLLGFIDPSDWKARVATIEKGLDRVFEPRASEAEAQIHAPVSFSDDRIAWYLYLADAALNNPVKYEPAQGSRILPIFKRLGAHLDLLRAVAGVKELVVRMLTNDRRQPDSILFELLVALLWCRNGFERVEFIEKNPPGKSPDIRAGRGTAEWFIECKRLQQRSEYSEIERLKWLTMWTRFRPFLLGEQFSAVFEIVFHVELHTLPNDFLVEELPGKLRLIQLPCDVIANETWSVRARPVDYKTAREHLAKYLVRYPSDQITELIGGYRDPNCGFTALIKGRFEQMGEGGGKGNFLDELAFAAGAFWSCDAPSAIERKARDIRRHLSEAVRQLPDSGKCAIHVGLETLEGATVEMVRLSRILETVAAIDTAGRDLRWIYCHQFQSYAPPDEAWVIDETVHPFGRKDSGPDPLKWNSLVVPQEGDNQDGVHWLRKPP
jgi:hypothetical protein